VLFEGAQGTMLDIDHGTYPYVTSSSATSGGAATGVGVPPTKIKHVLGISKAYTTRVGGGPFPTEMPDLDAKEVRERGKEFGAVTGRPRRCGWLDLQVLRYAKMINGIDSLVITKLDVFDTQREIQVCVGYKYKGTPLKEMPALAEEYEHVIPEYKTLPGWNETTYGLKDAAKLPKAAIDYLRFVSDFLQVEIGMISTGPERDATIVPAGTLLARCYSQQPKIHTMLTYEQARNKVVEQVGKRKGPPATAVVSVWDALGLVLAQKFRRTANIRHLTARRAMGTRCVRKKPRRRTTEVCGRNQSRRHGERSTGLGNLLASHDGCRVPAGADAVVMIEHTSREGDVVRSNGRRNLGRTSCQGEARPQPRRPF